MNIAFRATYPLVLRPSEDGPIPALISVSPSIGGDLQRGCDPAILISSSLVLEANVRDSESVPPRFSSNARYNMRWYWFNEEQARACIMDRHLKSLL